jgi:hypothetical protein
MHARSVRRACSRRRGYWWLLRLLVVLLMLLLWRLVMVGLMCLGRVGAVGIVERFLLAHVVGFVSVPVHRAGCALPGLGCIVSYDIV